MLGRRCYRRIIAVFLCGTVLGLFVIQWSPSLIHSKSVSPNQNTQSSVIWAMDPGEPPNEGSMATSGAPDVLILPDKISLVSILCLNKGKPDDINRQMDQVHVLLKTLLLNEYEYLRPTVLQEQVNTTEPWNIPEDYKALELILILDNKTYYDQVQDYLVQEFNPEYSKLLELVYVPAVYPEGYEHLRPMYAPCATLRLFIDQLLPGQHDFVYLDTDIVFLKSVREIYKEFSTFNGTQWAGMAPDVYNFHMLSLRPNTRYPYYGSKGLNAGIGVYNLTRLRKSDFSKSIGPILEKYNKSIAYADQDVLNIYFSSHSDEVKELSCTQNFIMPHCKPEGRCTKSLETGVSALHGAGLGFRYTSPEPLFLATFQFFQELNMKDVQDIGEVQNRLRETTTEKQKSPPKNKPWSTCHITWDFGDALLGKLNDTKTVDTVHNKNYI